MKYIKLWLVILFMGLLETVSAQITFFEGTFEDAVAKAKKERSMFYRFLCWWCELVSKWQKGFHIPEVGEYFNKILFVAS